MIKNPIYLSDEDIYAKDVYVITLADAMGVGTYNSNGSYVIVARPGIYVKETFHCDDLSEVLELMKDKWFPSKANKTWTIHRNGSSSFRVTGSTINKFDVHTFIFNFLTGKYNFI